MNKTFLNYGPRCLPPKSKQFTFDLKAVMIFYKSGVWVTEYQGQTEFSSGDLTGEESASKLMLNDGKVSFLVVISLRDLTYHPLVKTCSLF